MSLGRQRGSNGTVCRQAGDKQAADKQAAHASRAISQHADNTYISTCLGGQ